MRDKVKYMPIEEFRALGWVQEINRRMLHPAGLALEVVVEEDGTEHLGGIWDYRDDPEGIVYGGFPEEQIARSRALAKDVSVRSVARKKKLGFVVEPLKRTTLAEDND